ncbi:hypothetical protein E3E23_07190 [Thermococcus sp. CX2]|uniref:hypothetical protein n=1 Tax=Thermococcus sp. CX2 TaxID=163006 RepID=UPI00143BCE66|nr:hypothetical protein [Thermococcus sp. CX2]NJE85605.1 hypothetical protein [Thermococcus sp. CX2]
MERSPTPSRIFAETLTVITVIFAFLWVLIILSSAYGILLNNTILGLLITFGLLGVVFLQISRLLIAVGEEGYCDQKFNILR